MTRSGIPSTDEVLEILGGYHFERIFPVDSKNEERTRIAGLHLWYQVKFDEGTDLQEAARRLSQLGEISKVQGNSRIKRAYNPKKPSELCEPGSPATAGSHPKRSSGRKILRPRTCLPVALHQLRQQCFRQDKQYGRNPCRLNSRMRCRLLRSMAEMHGRPVRYRCRIGRRSDVYASRP